MNLKDYQQILSEKTAIEQLLSEIPEDHVIDRLGLEERKQDIEALLATHPTPNREPVRTVLTFRGKPIVGTHGIFAEFGATALNAFSEAVAAIGASLARPLGSRGVLPNRDDFRLLITGTATGSFGFQLEEAAQENLALFPAESPLESAVGQTQAILRATLGTDDELLEAIQDADPRAIETIRKFLEAMEKSEATCSLEFKNEKFRFSDVEQVKRSMNRLAQDNIHETDESLAGEFIGYLPFHRTFEFRATDNSEVYYGKADKDLVDADGIAQILGKPVSIRIHKRRIGDGKPRYVLSGYTVNHSES